MTTHRRHGLELRGGRWCSAKDLKRLRDEAIEGGLEEIERYLRVDQRCGTPLHQNRWLVLFYICELARRKMPGTFKCSMGTNFVHLEYPEGQPSFVIRIAGFVGARKQLVMEGSYVPPGSKEASLMFTGARFDNLAQFHAGINTAFRLFRNQQKRSTK